MRRLPRTRRTAVALVTAWLSLSGTATPVLAAVRCPRTTEVAMESKIMCQVCGVPLALANSLEADRERALITRLVNRCETASQIERAMVVQYGPGILATPGTHGFAITAWLVPAIGLLAASGVVALVLVSTRRRRGTDAHGPPAEAVSAAEDARLDAVLSAYSTRDWRG